MQSPIFITGIGTDVGKTLVSAIVTEAICGNYWKPVQAGFAEGTDAEWVTAHLSNTQSQVYPELYRLETPASPHIAARIEGKEISAKKIVEKARDLLSLSDKRPLIIEGAGGLLVPLSTNLMVADLIKELNAKLILVSRNYLGSINHSLLTANYCRYLGLDVAGWIFNDDYLSYEEEIVQWSGYPSIGSIPAMKELTKTSIHEQAEKIKESLQIHLIR